MLYLGIDIAKNTHVASLINDHSKIIFKGFSFSNTSDGGESLIAKLYQHLDAPKDVSIGMEATGHYWLSLYSFLLDKGFSVHVINPIQTDGWRKGIEIRKRKTDQIDSFLIADLIRYGDFVETSLGDEDLLSLRNLSRFRHYLVESIGDLKRKTIAILDQSFPEYSSFFSDVFGKTSTEILLNFQTADDFLNISSSKLEKVLENVKIKTFATNKITKISEAAANSFAFKFATNSFSLQIKFLVEQIKFIEAQVSDVEVEMKLILHKLNSTITTIPGISTVTGSVILSEIGDISRFSNPSKFVAFAGLDASVSQSGESISRHRMSKRGSPYLRKAIFQAAIVASFNDPVFSAFYKKKRSEGKHHLTAIGAVSRKLCYTIHAILTKNEPYRVQNL
jgi:transposase